MFLLNIFYTMQYLSRESSGQLANNSYFIFDASLKVVVRNTTVIIPTHEQSKVGRQTNITKFNRESQNAFSANIEILAIIRSRKKSYLRHAESFII